VGLLLFILQVFDMGIIINCICSLPLALWIILTIHEISHFLCFEALGYSVRQLRIGLADFRYDSKRVSVQLREKGMFYGCCTIRDSEKKYNKKIILSLLAGGLSGFFICIMSLILLFVKSVPDRWIGFVIALAISGIYSFIVTLLIPSSGDRLQIKMIKGEST
jgi:hypothetical protein